MRAADLWRLRWRALCVAWDRWSHEHFEVVVAGLAFRGTMVAFPAALAAVALASLVFDGESLAAALSAALEPLPAEARGVISNHVERMDQKDSSTIGFGLAVLIVVALWSASNGMKALLRSYCLVYNLPQRLWRWKDLWMSVAMGGGLLLTGVIMIAILVVVPAVIAFLHLGMVSSWLSLVIHWLTAGSLLLVIEWLLPRLATGGTLPGRTGLGFGSILSVAGWIIASRCMALALEYYGRFGEVYGTIAGVLILMLWMQATAGVLIYGALVNAALLDPAILHTKADDSNAE